MLGHTNTPTHTQTNKHPYSINIYRTRADARRGESLQKEGMEGGWIRADARLRADARGPG